MKTENFDDAIRQKIENINPRYDENEIDKTLDYVTRNRNKSFTQSYAAIILASLFGLIVIGLLIWNLSQQKTQKQLTQTIDSLRNNLAQAEKSISAVKDTVYVTKYITESNSIQQSRLPGTQTKQEGKNTFVASKDYIPQNAKTNARSNDYDKSSVSDQSQSTQLNNSSTSSPKIEFAVANLDVNKNNGDDKSHSEAGTYTKQSADSGLNLSANERNAELGQKINTKTNSDKQEVKSSDVAPATPNQPPLTDISESDKGIVKPDNAVATNEQGNNTSNTLPADTNKQHKPFAFLKKWYYQAGLGYETGDGLRALGVTGEAYVSRKWSISLGVRLAEVNNENYDDDDAYHRKKGKNFHQAYSADVSDTSAFSHIEIHTSLIQLPLMLKYHIALNNYFSLLAGIGTDIDLYAKQHVGYHHPENNSSETLKNFDAIPATELFNNAKLTVGMQGQWKHFVLQATTFISQQLVSVPYKKDDLYFGFGTQLLYAF